MRACTRGCNHPCAGWLKQEEWLGFGDVTGIRGVPLNALLVGVAWRPMRDLIAKDELGEDELGEELQKGQEGI